MLARRSEVGCSVPAPNYRPSRVLLLGTYASQPCQTTPMPTAQVGTSCSLLLQHAIGVTKLIYCVSTCSYLQRITSANGSWGFDDNARAHVMPLAGHSSRDSVLHPAEGIDGRHAALHCCMICQPATPRLSPPVRGGGTIAVALLHLRSSHILLALPKHRGQRRAPHGSRHVVCAGHSDILHSLVTTLRGAGDGSPPSLHGKVALVTGGSRGLPADHLLVSAKQSTFNSAQHP